MEAQTKLEMLSNQYNLPLHHNDRLFYGKYLYRASIHMYRYQYPELMRVPTFDTWGWKVDTQYRTSFISTLRRFTNKHGDRIRIENQTLNYYTEDINRLQKIIEYVIRLKRKEEDITDLMLDLIAIRYFPGTLSQRNIHYRKKRLPYNKFKFQIQGAAMDREQFENWVAWANQYPDDIRINNADQTRKWGTWCGDNIGYISTDKMLQLVQFKLGSTINKIIEYQIREQN